MDEIKIIAALTSLGYKRFNKNFIFYYFVSYGTKEISRIRIRINDQ